MKVGQILFGYFFQLNFFDELQIFTQTPYGIIHLFLHLFLDQPMDFLAWQLIIAFLYHFTAFSKLGLVGR